MKKYLLAFFSLFLIVRFNTVNSQPVEQMIKVVVAPNHPDWLYKTGEPVKFSISVLQYGNPLKNAVVRYSIGPEKIPWLYQVVN